MFSHVRATRKYCFRDLKMENIMLDSTKQLIKIVGKFKHIVLSLPSYVGRRTVVHFNIPLSLNIAKKLNKKITLLPIYYPSYNLINSSLYLYSGKENGGGKVF